MKNVHFLLCLALVLLAGQAGISQPALVVNQITTVTTPVDMTGAGDGSNRLFIVDKSGKIRIFNQTTNTLLPGIFLDISSLVLNNGERGLLG
ncbi:MAG: hypothetical protein ABIO24_11485, partial [Saprospiraceae bacterium]